MKKHLYFFAAALILLAGCKKTNTPTSAVSPFFKKVNPTEIDVRKLNPHAVEYYKDMVVMAEWYADHPEVLQETLDYNNTHAESDSGYNGLISELSDLNIEDSTGQKLSFFELNDEMRHALMRDYVKEEALFLSEKLDLADPDAAEYIIAKNEAADQVANTAPFSDTLDFDVERAKITGDNPYITMMRQVDNQLMPVAAGTPPYQEDMSMNDFLRELVTLRILAVAVGPFDPITQNNNTQNFVDKMRPHLQKGRVLVAMPGGNERTMPIAFNGSQFDFGHVAIVIRDASEVPANVPDDYALTIGTNSKDHMHEEPLAKDWVNHHGKSYLMEPVRKTRVWKYAFGFIPYWETRIEAVNNSKTYEKIMLTMGRRYADLLEMPFAKLAAPERFICSSSAWWAINEAHDINISDWSLLKPTIFPSGVFESSDMRIVAKTF